MDTVEATMRRLRTQFSLRGLVVVLTVAAIPLAWVAQQRNLKNAERITIQALFSNAQMNQQFVVAANESDPSIMPFDRVYVREDFRGPDWIRAVATRGNWEIFQRVHRIDYVFMQELGLSRPVSLYLGKTELANFRSLEEISVSVDRPITGDEVAAITQSISPCLLADVNLNNREGTESSLTLSINTGMGVTCPD